MRVVDGKAGAGERFLMVTFVSFCFEEMEVV